MDSSKKQGAPPRLNPVADADLTRVAPFVVLEVSHEGAVDFDDLQHLLGKECLGQASPAAAIVPHLYPAGVAPAGALALEWYWLGERFWCGAKRSTQSVVQIHFGLRQDRVEEVKAIDLALAVKELFPRVVKQYRHQKRARGLRWDGQLHVDGSPLSVVLTTKPFGHFFWNRHATSPAVVVLLGGATVLAKSIAATATPSEYVGSGVAMALVAGVAWVVGALQSWGAAGRRPRWTLSSEWERSQ